MSDPFLALPFGFTEIALTVGILILFFGAKKLPLIARGLGSGIRNFKGELAAPSDDAEAAENEEVERVLR